MYSWKKSYIDGVWIGFQPGIGLCLRFGQSLLFFRHRTPHLLPLALRWEFRHAFFAHSGRAPSPFLDPNAFVAAARISRTAQSLAFRWLSVHRSR